MHASFLLLSADEVISRHRYVQQTLHVDVVVISYYCSLGCWAVVGFPAISSPGQEVTPTPNETAETERVIVTGSNIPTASEVGPNPVLSISRERIEKSSERTTEELIRSLTIAGPNGVPTSNNAAGATPGCLVGIANWRLQVTR